MRTRLVALGTMILLTLSRPSLTTTAVASDPTCQGLTPTITAAGGTVTGTEGNDVILVTGVGTVSALGGDDTLCVSGGTVDAGAGNDSVTVLGGGLETAHLGAGDDHYVDPTNAFDVVDPVPGDSAGTDTISTGPNVDTVDSGVIGEPNDDVIDLGADQDGLTALLPAGSQISAVGGPPGETGNLLTLKGDPAETASWDVQLPETVTRDGVSVGSFSGFSGTTDLSFGPGTSLGVRGTDGPDSVAVNAGTLAVDLGDGRDGVDVFSAFGVLPTAGQITLGHGHRDYLDVQSLGDVSLDLGQKRATFEPGSGSVAVHGVEVSTLAAPRVTYRGSSGDDIAYAVGCQVRMDGGPGDDQLSYADDGVRPTLPSCAEYRFRLHGDAGDDTLTGWTGRDVLVGGPGRDEANGKQNVDVCRAEVERQCEH